MSQRAEVPQVIDSEALALARALRWIPLEHHAVFNDIYLLRDFERGWFLSLYLACCRSPIPGYLGPITGSTALDLWKFAGARSERSFRGHSAKALAAYRFAEFDGEKYLYHPRLLTVIVEQLTKLHKRRRGDFSTLSSVSTSGEQLPLLLFQVLKKEKAQGRGRVGEASNEQIDRIRERARKEGITRSARSR